jgi:hypothetical protein
LIGLMCAVSARSEGRTPYQNQNVPGIILGGVRVKKYNPGEPAPIYREIEYGLQHPASGGEGSPVLKHNDTPVQWILDFDAFHISFFGYISNSRQIFNYHHQFLNLNSK